MRFVSTAFVMMTIALMLLALMLLGPATHAKSDDLRSEPNRSPPKNSQTTVENGLSNFNIHIVNFGGGEIIRGQLYPGPRSHRPAQDC
jgi:hypothetical protein